MAKSKKALIPLPPPPPPLFALEALAEWRKRRIGDALPPAVVRKIVHVLLTRGNFRRYSELYVANLATVYSQWLIQVVFAARREYGAEWRAWMLEAIQEELAHPIPRVRKTDPASHAVIDRLREARTDLEKLKSWLLTTTSKTDVNLDHEDVPGFLREGINENRTRFETQPWGTSLITLAGYGGDKDPVHLTAEESTWLLRMAGSASVAARGSAKSLFGKCLEGAFLRTCFRLLGVALDVYELNAQPVSPPPRATVKRGQRRQRDAVLRTAEGAEILLEMGLIGKGNSEVVKDKIGRVGENGIVIYDSLPKNGNAADIAAEWNVALIGLRGVDSPSPAHDLHNALVERHVMAEGGKPLLAPPEPNRLGEVLEQMDDGVFRVSVASEEIREAVEECDD